MATARKENDAEQVLDGVRQAPAALSDADLSIIEARLADGVTRRAALALLTQPGAHILNAAAKDQRDAQALAAIAMRAKAEVNFYRQLADTLNQAVMRSLVALAQRDDCQELINGALAEMGDSSRGVRLN